MSILMQMRIARSSIVVFAGALLGCSMHPLPEDVSRQNTYDIVEKIRCEAVEGLRGLPRDHPILASTYIGYDFDFDIEENSNAGVAGTRANLTFERKSIPRAGTQKIEATPYVERQRKTKRTFRIIESLRQLSQADCAPDTMRANWMYPMAGAIGMNEIVRTYVGLERLTNFGRTTATTTDLPGGGFDETAAGKIPVVFSDVITFTTNLGIGLKPTLTLASTVGSLKVTSASILGDATRKDIHKVTVALARGKDALVDPPEGTRAMRVQTEDERYVDRASRAALYNPRLSRAADAVAQKSVSAETRVLLELERRRDDEEFLATRLLEILKPPS